MHFNARHQGSFDWKLYKASGDDSEACQQAEYSSLKRKALFGILAQMAGRIGGFINFKECMRLYNESNVIINYFL